MISIDGSQGEGGGQIIRSSLALSLVTGKPVTIDSVRAGRKKPGLMRQHLACVRAAKQISEAEVEGDEIGSKRLVFRPGAVRAGDYRFRVGSAGSTTLVFQTVLPALMLTEGTSTIELEGGTHNPFAPPYDFLAKAYLPLLRRVGPVVELSDCRPGFYPGGGGSFRATVRPAQQLKGIELLEQGKLIDRRVRALVSNLPWHIADRECKGIARKTGWPEKCFAREEVKGSLGPGNVVMIELEYEHVTEVFVAFGEVGKKAERVANEVLRGARAYMASAVPIGPFLADQLMLPIGLASHFGQRGSLKTMPLTQHSTTHIDVLRRFLNVTIHIESGPAGEAIVNFSPGGGVSEGQL
jgi:RNA 3'-terminal phosphate cyclase (ATP)